MCGIAGYLTVNGNEPDPRILENMCSRLRHRGPEATGYFIGRTVALGHQRLRIIDVAGGDQPLTNEDGTLQIIFNGEIYNYLELRQELVKKGHRFTTRSDTEVMVHLYEDVGERLPEYLNGMFAIAIWDERRQELFLARDRFGKKPLYYSSSVHGMRFCFGSELKALTAIPGFDPEVDQKSVFDFLCLTYVPDPATIFRNVYKLKPGHSLTVSATGERLRRYWAPHFSTGTVVNVAETVEELRSLAADAVERRMISDVPLGAFLSGGVDSSAVVGFMAAASREPIKTFSIGFTNKSFDETDFARLVVERHHTDHYSEIVTPSIDRVFNLLVEHFDEPFADPSAIPTLYVSELARRHVTVALSGDGADEVFGGYRRYLWEARENRLRSMFPKWFRKSVVAFAARHYPVFEYMPRIFRAKSTLQYIARELGDAYFSHMSVFFDGGIEDVVAPENAAELNHYSPRESFARRFEAVQHLSPLQQMQAVDFDTYLPGDILVKVDRASMAFSLEARAPWLDYRLAELACRLPSSLLLRGDIGKYIFKQAIAPHVPAEVISRPKMGFGVPLAEWLRTGVKPLFEALVFRKDMEAYLNMPGIRKIWNEHQAGHDHGRKLWSLLMLSAWDAHLRKAPQRELLACS
jgi:asparagine synthase (glutamine-hydrolysing)